MIVLRTCGFGAIKYMLVEPCNIISYILFWVKLLCVESSELLEVPRRGAGGAHQERTVCWYNCK